MAGVNAMNFLTLIEAKRDGQALSTEQIEFLVAASAAGKIPDYQLAALLMAIFFRGLNRAETRALTLAMSQSGEVLRFPDDERPLVDKHSTGGVGDKVSLALVPLLACLGFRVPMISGRGLGITGGTLDKLESIPGLTTTLPVERIIAQVQEVGCVICGQTGQVVPADKALYALRDVTGTVPSIPLITASILSKKLAEGIGALLLDVKFGSAAFMKTQEQAQELAQVMVNLGQECGVQTRALLTDMNAPLGQSAGNWLEVKEVTACLEGKGPKDLEELVLASAAHLLMQTGKAVALETAHAQAAKCLASGKAQHQWEKMLAAQGVNLTAFHRKLALDHTANIVQELTAHHDGFVSRCDAKLIGEVIRDLGGGRSTKESIINPDVGIDRLAKPGTAVRQGAILCRVHAADEASALRAGSQLQTAFAFSDGPPGIPALIQQVITPAVRTRSVD
jgi:pyrimidine-nucleoside phosphorylase